MGEKGLLPVLATDLLADCLKNTMTLGVTGLHNCLFVQHFLTGAHNTLLTFLAQ